MTVSAPSSTNKQMQAAEVVAISHIGETMRVGISGFGSWMLGVGTIIGSMAWLIHGPMLARAGNVPTITAWVIAALMNLPLAFILSELSSMFPSAGGPYVYKYVALKRLFPAIGEFLGFATGWIYWIAMITGMACMANGFAGLVSSSVYADPAATPHWFGPLVIAALCVGTTIMNLHGISRVSQMNNVLTLGKIGLAVAFVLLVASAKSSSFSNVTVGFTGAANFVPSIMGVLVLSITAFSGIELVGCTSSETKNPTRNIPRAIIFTLITVTLIYVALSLAICSASPYVPSSSGGTMVVPGTSIQASCPSLAGFLGGKMWGALFTAGVIVSIVACNFNALLAMSRISYSMSETKLFPARFSKLDAKDSVPKQALWFVCWCLLILSAGTNIASQYFSSFDPYMFLGEVFGFLYACLAVLYGVCFISLRYTEPELPRPFRLGKSGNALAWFVAILASAVYGFVAVECAQLSHQITAGLLLLAGLPIYLFYRRPRLAPKSSGSD